MTAVTLALGGVSVDADAQIRGWGLGPVIWIGGGSGGGQSGGSYAAGGYGLHAEYGRGRATAALQVEAFGSAADCKLVCSTVNGKTLSGYVLLTVAEGSTRRLILGPNLSFVRWTDMESAISGQSAPKRSLGAGIAVRGEVLIGKGTFYAEPFVRTAVGYNRAYYGGLTIALIARP